MVTLIICFLATAVSLDAQTLTHHSTLQFPGTFHTDVWGYEDSVSGKEYAILGDAAGGGITIVDVSDPDTPQQIANVSTVPGFDLKIWDHFVYTVNGGGFGDGNIINISDPANPVVVGTFPSSHNIFISDNGQLYAESPGARIYNLVQDPLHPNQIWSDSTSGGHDATVVGDLFYDFHGTAGTFIYDVSHPGTPQLLGSIQDPAISYHHSGSPTEDGNYLLICDELATHPQADITVWDISNLSNPQKVDEYADANAIVHNLYIVGNYAFVAYYTAGIRVFDISDPTNIQMVAEFDTDAATGETFSGAFGVYPFTTSGNIYINDWHNGLFVFSFEPPWTAIDEPGQIDIPQEFYLAQNFPNPFNPATQIRYDLPQQSHVRLTIYNLLGQELVTLVNKEHEAGSYQAQFDGEGLASGVYLYRIQAGDFVDTKRLLLLK